MVFIELGLNVTVAVLLAVTLAYCWRLNRRIRALQDGKSELARLLKHFDESTRRAADSIAALQIASRKLGETIQGRIDKANLVADDLMFLIERAGKLSDEMEAGLAARRAADAALTSSLRAAGSAGPAPKIESLADPRPQPRKPAAPPAKSADAPSPNTRALLEALGQKAAGKPAPERKRVEQELLELIKAGG